jgi:ribosome-binding protein aMBF1 (putative translation factor)
MLEHTKKLRTESIEVILRFKNGKDHKYLCEMSRFDGLKSYLEKKSERSIPWEEVAKERIEKFGKPALLLRGARRKAELTQKQLADKVGIDQSNLSAMECGKRPIGKEMAKKLAKALKTNYRYFL